MTIENIAKDLRNPITEGFFIEALGDCLTARRLNQWQWDVTYENRNGREYTEKMREDEILRRVSDFLDVDDNATYIPHFRLLKWDAEKVDKFMRGLAPQMCKMNFVGFKLTADKNHVFTVLRHPNSTGWYVDGKYTDFSGALRKTRAKLAEDIYWEYTVL